MPQTTGSWSLPKESIPSYPFSIPIGGVPIPCTISMPVTVGYDLAWTVSAKVEVQGQMTGSLLGHCFETVFFVIDVLVF